MGVFQIVSSLLRNVFFCLPATESMCSDIGDAPFNILSLGNFYRSDNFKYTLNKRLYLNFKSKAIILGIVVRSSSSKNSLMPVISNPANFAAPVKSVRL